MMFPGAGCELVIQELLCSQPGSCAAERGEAVTSVPLLSPESSQSYREFVCILAGSYKHR